MQTFISTKEEFKQTIMDAVQQVVTQKLPEIIRRANAKEYYSIGEAIKILNCTRRHLQYLRDSGQIGYVKNGKKIYFRSADLEKFFSNNYIENEGDRK